MTITLDTKESKGCGSWRNGDPIPEGMTIVSTPFTLNISGEQKQYFDNRFTYPTLGECHLYDSLSEVVLTINGRNYTIEVELGGEGYGEDYDYWDEKIPYSAVVKLNPTDRPATTGDLYDIREYNLKNLARLKQKVAEDIKEIEGYGDEREKEWLMEYVERDKKDIERIENGENIYAHRRPIQVFGQPQFIQNPICPVVDGRGAYHLVTLNTDWGDSGNVNIMVTLDEDGVPSKAFFEASCC